MQKNYEGVEKLFIKNIRSYANRFGSNSQIRGEDVPSKFYSDIGKCAVRRKQRYVDHPRYRFQLTYLIHILFHSSDESKLIDYFGNKYAQGGTFKELSQDPATKKLFVKKQEVNYISQKLSLVVILQET